MIAQLVAFQFVSALLAQTFPPLAPRLLVEEMGLPVPYIGTTQLVFSACVLCGVCGAGTALSHLGLRATLQAACVLRAVAGAIHVAVAARLVDRSLFALFLAGRALHGLSVATYVLPAVWFQTHLAAEARPRALSLAQSALGVGVAAGPVVGGALAAMVPSRWDTAAPGAALAVVSTVQLALRPFPPADHHPPPSSGRMPSATCGPHARPASIAIFFLNLAAFGCLEGTLAVQLRDRFGWSAEDASWRVYAPLAVSTVAATMAVPHLLERLGWKPLLVSAQAGVAIGGALMATRAAWVLGLGCALFCHAIAYTAILVHLTLELPEGRAGDLFGVQTAGQLGRCVGPLLFTSLYAWTDLMFVLLLLTGMLTPLVRPVNTALDVSLH